MIIVIVVEVVQRRTQTNTNESNKSNRCKTSSIEHQQVNDQHERTGCLGSIFQKQIHLS